MGWEGTLSRCQNSLRAGMANDKAAAKYGEFLPQIPQMVGRTVF